MCIRDRYIGVLAQGKRGTPNYKVRVVQSKDLSLIHILQPADLNCFSAMETVMSDLMEQNNVVHHGVKMLSLIHI